MNALDAVDYRNANKNRWRHSVWAAICAKIPARERGDSVVLYLPGSTDLDRPLALRRGFKAYNLIAIERDASVAKHLRARNCTVLRCDLAIALLEWPDHVCARVVIADLQSPLIDEVFAIHAIWASRKAFDGGMLVINMQRGRERPDSFVSSEDVRAYKEAQKTNATNRAALFMALTAPAYCRRNGAQVDGADIFKAANQFIDWRVLPPYRSAPGAPLMDSVVICDKGRTQRLAEFAIQLGKDGEAVSLQPKESMRARISAALAVRTMRASGQLPSGVPQ